MTREEKRYADARQHGALRGAAEWALEMLIAPPSYIRDPRESAIQVLRRALAHDGSEDYYERVPTELGGCNHNWVTDETGLIDDCTICGDGRA